MKKTIFVMAAFCFSLPVSAGSGMLGLRGIRNLSQGSDGLEKLDKVRKKRLLRIVKNHGYESLELFSERFRADLLESFQNPTILLEDGRSPLLGQWSFDNGYYGYLMHSADKTKSNWEKIKSIQSEIFWSTFDIKNPLMRRNLFDLLLTGVRERKSESLRGWRHFLKSRLQFLSEGIDRREMNTHLLNTFMEKGTSESRHFEFETDVLFKALLKNAKSFEDSVNVNILSLDRVDFKTLRGFLNQVVFARTDSTYNSVFERLHDLASSGKNQILGRILVKVWEKAKLVEAEGEGGKDFVALIEYSLKREIYRIHHNEGSPSLYKAKDVISDGMRRSGSLADFVHYHREIAERSPLRRQEEILLNRELSPSQREALERAHRVGDGEDGLVKGIVAGVDNYTETQLLQKIKILRDAGFGKEERELLVKSGIAGRKRIKGNKNKTSEVIVQEKGRVGSKHGVMMTLYAGRSDILENENVLKKLHDKKLMSGLVDDFVNGHLDVKMANLFMFLNHGHPRLVTRLIEGGANPKIKNTNGDTILHVAAERGNDELVGYILEKGIFKSHLRNREGMTPFHKAIENNNRESARILLESGANVSEKIKSGKMALHLAAESGDREILELLLEHGADITAKTKEGRDILQLVAERGNEELVEFVLTRGKDGFSPESLSIALQSVIRNKSSHQIVELLVESGANPSMALEPALESGSIDMARLLLAKGADVNFATKNGATALHGAIAGGDRESIEFLVDNGADVHRMADDGRVALQMAFDSGDRDLVEYLLRHGADINTSARDGRRVLHKALERGDNEMFRFFLEQGADIKLPARNGKMALDFAIENKAGHETIEAILERMEDVNHVANDGMRALDRAIDIGDGELVRMLMAAKADTGLVNGSGRSAFQRALDMKNKSIVHLFLESGLEPEKITNALQEAVSKGSHEGVEILLSGGVDPNVLKNGLSAFHVAIKNGNVDMTRILLEWGADPRLETGEGLSPLWLGVRSGNKSVVKTLLKKKADGSVRLDGSSVLHQAVEDRNDGMLGILLREGLDPNMVDKNGMTALHKAVVISGKNRSIRLLLEYGADFRALDNEGKTPYDLAVKLERKDILKLFIEKG